MPVLGDLKVRQGNGARPGSDVVRKQAWFSDWVSLQFLSRKQEMSVGLDLSLSKKLAKMLVKKGDV